LATQISADELQVLTQLSRRKMTTEELARALRWASSKANHVAYGLSHGRPNLVQQDVVSMKWGITRFGRAYIPRR
jgi:RNase P/RNase MRP subunit POP5